MAEKKYEVQETDWLDGVYRTKGDVVHMDENAAKFLVLNGQLKLKDDTAERKAASAADKAKKGASTKTATIETTVKES